MKVKDNILTKIRTKIGLRLERHFRDKLIAVVIESEEIAKTQRAIFELAWRGAETFNK